MEESLSLSQWILSHWEWILLGFFILEKVVKLSPSKKDDILLDTVIKPIFNALTPKSKK